MSIRKIFCRYDETMCPHLRLFCGKTRDKHICTHPGAKQELELVADALIRKEPTDYGSQVMFLVYPKDTLNCPLMDEIYG